MIFSRNKAIAAPKPARKPVGTFKDNDNIDDIIGNFIPAAPKPKPVAPPSTAIKAPGMPNQNGSVNTGPKAMFFGPDDDGQGGPPFNISEPTNPNQQAAVRGTDPTAALRARQEAARAEQARAEAADVERRRNEQAAARGNARIDRNNAAETEQNRDLDGDGKIAGKLMTEQDYIDAILRDMLQPVPGAEAARQATIDETKQATAEAAENARAVTGRAGMGNSGAAGAAVGRQLKQGARNEALTLQDFDQKQRAEQLQRNMLALQQAREQYAFNESKDIYEDEAPSRRDFPEGAEGDQAFKDAINTYYAGEATSDAIVQDAQDTNRSVQIEGMNQSRFEAVSKEELEGLGWKAVEGPMSDGPNDRFYFVWESPTGVRKKAYIDGMGEWLSSGAHWQ